MDDDLTDVAPELEKGLSHAVWVVTGVMEAIEQPIDGLKARDAEVEFFTVDSADDLNDARRVVRHVLGRRWERESQFHALKL